MASIIDQDPFNEYTGNGSTTVYPYTFHLLSADDLVVSIDLVETTAFTLSGVGVQSGGEVTFTVAPPNLSSILISRRVELARDTDYQYSGELRESTLDRDFNRLWQALQDTRADTGGVIRAPYPIQLNDLPGDPADFPGYFIGIDSVGQPAYALAPTGTAADVVTRLASTSPGNGAEMVGFIQSGTGAVARTAQDKMREVVSVKDFGALNNDGSTDDYSVFALAAASTAKFIDARGLNCRIGSQLNIPAGQVWLLHGSTFTFTGTASTMWAATNVDNWALIGPFTIVGDLVTDPGTGVSSKGISVSNCANWRVVDPTIKNVRGYGMHIAPGANTRARGDGGVVVNPKLDACVWGWHDDPGSAAEYVTVINVRAISNAQAGIETSAGNVNWVGGHVIDNVRDGVRVQNGSNHAHGIINGLNINHNPQYNVVCTQVLNGQSFDGCHIYGNGGSTGAIFLDKSKGIHFNGGHLDCQVYNYKDGSSGINVIENMYCPGSYGVNRQAGSNNGHDQLIFRNCWGPGVYQTSGGVESAGVSLNDPGLCFAFVQRDAASTQSLTSGVSATLTWSSAPFPDRRGAFNLGTGTFTVPSNSAGLYSVDFDLLFGGTAMNAATSYVELKVNGSTKKLFTSSIYSTTKLQIQGSLSLQLAASDVVIVTAVIVGTTPSFGDSTWPSNLTINRIA